MDTLEARRDTGLEQSYIERARELLPMLREAGDEIERRREVTPEIVEAMIERGIFRMLLPRSLGGAELDPLTYIQVLEKLAQGDGSPAWCLGQNSGCSMIAPYLAGGDRARGVRRPRRHPRLGAGPAGRRPRGRRRGRQPGHRALGVRDRQPARQLARRHMPLFEPDGSPRKSRTGASRSARCCFRKSEAQIIDNWQVIGLARHRQRQLPVEDIRAAEIHRRARQPGRAAREGAALPVHQRHDLRDGVLARVDGHRRGAFDAFIEIARDKVPRGAKGPCARTT